MVCLFFGRNSFKPLGRKKKKERSYIVNLGKETLETVKTQMKIHFRLLKQHSSKCYQYPASFLVEIAK